MATHRDPESMVAKGTFRLDLWHRIWGDTVVLPPLRERGDDILTLRDVCVERAVSEQGLRRVRWAPEAACLRSPVPSPASVPGHVHGPQ